MTRDIALARTMIQRTHANGTKDMWNVIRSGESSLGMVQVHPSVHLEGKVSANHDVLILSNHLHPIIQRSCPALPES